MTATTLGVFLCRYLGSGWNECGHGVCWVKFYILTRGIVAAFAGPPIPQAVCHGASIVTRSSQGRRRGCVQLEGAPPPTIARIAGQRPPRRLTGVAATEPQLVVNRIPDSRLAHIERGRHQSGSTHLKQVKD